MATGLVDRVVAARASAALEAAKRLNEAGYPVTEADGVPGLFDVAGIGRDLTIGQIIDVAARYVPNDPGRN